VEKNAHKQWKPLTSITTSYFSLITPLGWLRKINMELLIKEMKITWNLLEMPLLD